MTIFWRCDGHRLSVPVRLTKDTFCIRVWLLECIALHVQFLYPCRWMFHSVVSTGEVVDPGNKSPSGKNSAPTGTLADDLQQCRKENADLRERLRRYETPGRQPGSPPSGGRSSGSTELQNQLDECKRRERKLLEDIESLKRVSRQWSDAAKEIIHTGL